MKVRQSGFTLFEILISVALLSVLSVVLLRVFVLTADFWTAGDEQARLYADAKTALTVISQDLENAVYDTASVTSATGNTAPMWLEACDYTTSENLSAFNTIAGYGSGAYGPWLHLVTRTDWGRDADTHSHDHTAHKSRSEICKVSYLFAPPTAGGARSIINSNNFSADGELARVCRSDYQGSCSMKLNWYGGRPMAAAANSETACYFPINGTILSEEKKTILTGVLDFRVYAYLKAPPPGSDQYGPVPLQLDDGNLVPLSASGFTAGTSLTEGMKNITRIQIVLTLMPPERIAELRKISNAADQKEYIHKYARTFRKTVRIKEME